ncbi:MAG: transglycosylase SLT domain-containing protein [Luteimonas sp.]
MFRNADGSFDVGLMRIPSSALPALERYGITRERLMREDCLNIQVATYMMALRPTKPTVAGPAVVSLRPLPVDDLRAAHATAMPRVREACMVRSAQAFRLPIELLQAIAKTEGGQTGTVTRNRNGSVDMGVMQVNSIHLSGAPHRFLARGITAQQLINDDCVNIAAGASILRYEIDRASNFWSGVARYHSKTPYYASIYLGKVVRNLRAMGSGMTGRVAQ